MTDQPSQDARRATIGMADDPEHVDAKKRARIEAIEIFEMSESLQSPKHPIHSEMSGLGLFVELFRGAFPRNDLRRRCSSTVHRRFWVKRLHGAYARLFPLT